SAVAWFGALSGRDAGRMDRVRAHDSGMRARSGPAERAPRPRDGTASALMRKRLTARFHSPDKQRARRGAWPGLVGVGSATSWPPRKELSMTGIGVPYWGGVGSEKNAGEWGRRVYSLLLMRLG